MGEEEEEEEEENWSFLEKLQKINNLLKIENWKIFTINKRDAMQEGPGPRARALLM